MGAWERGRGGENAGERQILFLFPSSSLSHLLRITGRGSRNFVLKSYTSQLCQHHCHKKRDRKSCRIKEVAAFFVELVSVVCAPLPSSLFAPSHNSFSPYGTPPTSLHQPGSARAGGCMNSLSSFPKRKVRKSVQKFEIRIVRAAFRGRRRRPPPAVT